MNSHIGVTLRVMKNRVFSDGNGSSVKNLSCGLPRHFPHQPNLQVCLLLSRILSRNQLFVYSGRSLRAPCRSTGSWTRTEGWGSPTLVTHHRPTSCNFIILILILKTKKQTLILILTNRRTNRRCTEALCFEPSACKVNNDNGNEVMVVIVVL